MTRWKLWGLAGGLALGLMGCGGGDGQADDLASVAASQPQISKMVAAADAAGLMPAMQGDEPMTLLAPTDEALAEMADELAELMKPENKAELQDFVKAHLVPSKMLSSQMKAKAEGADASVANLQGDALEVAVEDGRLTINGAAAAQVDRTARNGVLHVFSRPIWRPSVFGVVRTLPQLETLEQAVRAAGLADALRADGGKTLFAPTNEAFRRLLAELNLSAEQLLGNKPLLTQVLTYHVLASRVAARDVRDDSLVPTLQGQAIAFDVQRRGFWPTITLTDARQRTSKVVLPNLHARNGIVHLVDRVILPQDKNLVQLAQANPQFSILVQAVVAAGLVDALSAPGPVTVFAPTNDAFAKLLAELKLSADQLLTNKPLLTEVLTYHVLPGRVLAAQIKDDSVVPTLQGQPLRLDTDGGGVRLTDARGRHSQVVAANVQAANGVIHVIDTVVLPTDRNLVQLAQSLPDFSILVEAVVAAELVDTLASPGPFTVFAPTNQAFANLLGELKVTKEQLLGNKELLTKVLLYHVVPGRVLKSQVPVGRPIATAGGATFTVGADLVITDAAGRRSAIVATDVTASNGVVHVIDKVILPPL